MLVTVDDDSGCDSGESRKLSNGAIAGIVIGATLFLVAIILLALVLVKKVKPSSGIFSASTDEKSGFR